MRILSINTGTAAPIQVDGQDMQSGIFKHPRSPAEPVFLGRLGLEGDEQFHKQVHGGADRALYIFSQAAYEEFWKPLLPAELLRPGTFGENVTLSRWDEEDIFVGDTFRLGTAVIQATMPRIPCAIFSSRIGLADAHDRIHESRRAGVLFRVLEEGLLRVGDVLERLERSRHSLSLPDFLAMVRNRKVKPADAELLQSIPEIPAQFRGRVPSWVIKENEI